jgi:hypothetical protein
MLSVFVPVSPKEARICKVVKLDGIELKVTVFVADGVTLAIASNKVGGTKVCFALGVDNEPDNKVETCIDGCA